MFGGILHGALLALGGPVPLTDSDNHLMADANIMALSHAWCVTAHGVNMMQ